METKTAISIDATMEISDTELDAQEALLILAHASPQTRCKVLRNLGSHRATHDAPGALRAFLRAWRAATDIRPPAKSAAEMARITTLSSGLPMRYSLPGRQLCVEQIIAFADRCFRFTSPSLGCRARSLVPYDSVCIKLLNLATGDGTQGADMEKKKDKIHRARNLAEVAQLVSSYSQEHAEVFLYRALFMEKWAFGLRANSLPVFSALEGEYCWLNDERLANILKTILISSSNTDTFSLGYSARVAILLSTVNLEEAIDAARMLEERARYSPGYTINRDVLLSHIALRLSSMNIE